MSINKTEIEEYKVSVIVPVYNVEEYIRECINWAVRITRS